MPKTSLLALLLLCARLAAAAADAGTGSLFNQAFSPRAVALGGAMVAEPGDAYSAAFNPASVDSGSQASVGALDAISPLDASIQYLGLHLPTADWGGLGLGVFYTGVGGIPFRDASGLANPSLDFGFNQSEVLAAYAKQIGMGLTLGLAGHDEMESLAGQGASSAGLDVGAIWQAGAWRVGAALDHLADTQLRLGNGGADLRGMLGRAGFSWAWQPAAGSWSARVVGEVDQQEYSNPAAAAGLEAGLWNRVALRIGFNTSGWAYGAGLSYSGFTFDYAFASSDLGGLHRFGLEYHFGRDVAAQRALGDARRQAEIQKLATQAALPLVEKARLEADQAGKKEREKLLRDESFKSLQYSQGLEALQAGRYGDAATAFDEVRKMDPRYLKVSSYLALAQSRLRYKNSGGMTEEMLVWYREGTAKFLQGDYKGAIEIWRKILQKDPGQRHTIRNIEEAQRRLDAGAGASQ